MKGRDCGAGGGVPDQVGSIGHRALRVTEEGWQGWVSPLGNAAHRGNAQG